MITDRRSELTNPITNPIRMMPELHDRADGVGPYRYRARTPLSRAAVYVIRDPYSRDRL